MENIKVIDYGDGNYMVVNDKKQRIFQIAFSSVEEINALTQTEINQIVQRIVAKYKLDQKPNLTNLDKR